MNPVEPSKHERLNVVTHLRSCFSLFLIDLGGFH